MRKHDDLVTWGELQAALKRIEKLEMDNNKHIKRINTLMADRTRIKKRIRTLEAVLNGIDAEKAARTMREYMDAVEATTERHGILQTKVTVLETMAYLLEEQPQRRGYAISGCVKSFESDDKFWKAIDRLPITQYATLFIRVGRLNRPATYDDLKKELDRKIGVVQTNGIDK